MQNNEKKIKSKNPQISNHFNQQKIRIHEDKMINQVFNSVKNSDKAIEDTLKSIEETMQFIKKLEEKQLKYAKR